MTRRARHIGIVAVSAEGAALCYRTICAEGAAMFGEHDHPEITMHTYSLAEYMQPIYEGDWSAAGERLLASARKCADAGAELLVCPDNTLHQAVELIRDRSPARWLHIAEEVARAAAERGTRALGVLGTRYLMEGPVYPRALEARRIAHRIPDEADRIRIDEHIFRELVYGRFEPETRRYFQQVIGALGEAGCDGVVLGCTEIPLLIREGESPLPAFDSTRLLARAALREAAA